jgi:hypothetical protein
MQLESTTERVRLLRRFVGSLRKDWISHLVFALFFELLKVLLHLMIW